MKKFFIIIFVFLAMSIYAQNSFLFPPKQLPELYCYNLTSSDLHEFNENIDLYKELIRDVLRKEKNNLFSMIIQGEEVFSVIVISTEPENEVSFLYNSSNKILKILSFNNFMDIEEKIVSNTSMFRAGSIIILDKLNIKFVIRQVEDLFKEMGIRPSAPLKGTI